MNFIKRIIGAVALAAMAAIGYVDDAFAGSVEYGIVKGTGAIVQCALDLSDVWDKCDVSAEPILWSSLGWGDEAEPESGKTVTLRLITRSDGEEQVLMEPQSGFRQIFTWTPGEVTKQVYNIRHVIVGDSPDLNAYFSFENYDHVAPSELDVRAAIRSNDGTGRNFGIVNDTHNWWDLVGGPGEGIAAPQGTSTFTFTVDGHGTLNFDYELIGGVWTISVDGVQMRTLAAAADWTAFSLTLEGMRAHTVVFSTELAEGNVALFRNVRWLNEDWRSSAGGEVRTAVDLRTDEVLEVGRAQKILPFTWSSTNFTGVIEVGPSMTEKVDPASVARVRVVQVTGAGDDLSQWTTEVAGTEKVLIANKPGEGLVKWRGATVGVWKAEFTILTGNNQVYTEKRILDMRKYVGTGMILFVM